MVLVPGGWVRCSTPVKILAAKMLLIGGIIATATLHAVPAHAKTGVAIDGTTVTITVPIDMYKLPKDGGRIVDMDTGQEHVYSDWLEQGGEQLWNDAFARLPYGGCLTFQVDIEIHPVSGTSTSGPDRGHHGINFDPYAPMVATVYDKIGTTDHNADTPFAFETSLTGDFGLIDQDIFAHEVGHLFGLGDDYVRGEDGFMIDGVVEGREEGTLMHSSHTSVVTQNIVDRIGGLIEQVHDLPACWIGTIESQTTRDLNDPVWESFTGGRCADTWITEVVFAISAERAISGRGTASLTDGPLCPMPLTAPPLAARTFEVTGSATDEALALELLQHVGTIGGDYAGYASLVLDERCSVLRSIVVPRTGDRTAEAETTYTNRCALAAPADVLTSANRIRLEQLSPSAP